MASVCYDKIGLEEFKRLWDGSRYRRTATQSDCELEVLEWSRGGENRIPDLQYAIADPLWEDAGNSPPGSLFIDVPQLLKRPDPCLRVM